jgi:hypothetical protein
VKQIRKRLTYANVMSSIAVFLVLGGGAAIAAGLAKNSVGSKQLKKNAVTSAKIKNNAVTTAKIKNGAITGAKVNAGTLGTVPNANHANTADSAGSAGSAGNADTVGGLRIVKFSLNGSGTIGKTEILNLNGLQLQASCSSGSVTLTATTSVFDGEISAWAEDASGTYTDGEGEYEDEFKPGVTFTAPEASNSDSIGDGAYTGGDLRTVRFFYNEEDEIGGRDCLLNGYAIG